MRKYMHNTHHGRLETYRGAEKLVLSERLLHSDAMADQLSLSIAKQQLEECYYFHSLRGKELSDDFLAGFNAGKEYIAIALESLLEDLAPECTSVTLDSGVFPVLTLDHLENDLSSDGNVIDFPED
jgi:hypothetical protein